MEQQVRKIYDARSAASEASAAKSSAAATKAAAAETKAAQKAAEEQEKAQNRLFSNRARLLASIARTEEKRSRDAERAAEREAAATERASARQVEAAERVARAEEAGRMKAGRAVDQLSKKVLALELRNERQSLGMVRSSAHVAHGLSHIAEGLTLIGVVSEASNEKLIRTLGAAHGIAEAFRGSLDVVSGLVHLTSQWERATRAVYDIEKAETALLAARAVAGGANAATTVGGGGIGAGVGAGLGESAAFGLGASGAGRLLTRGAAREAEEITSKASGGVVRSAWNWATQYGGPGLAGGAATGMLGRLASKALPAARFLGSGLLKFGAVPLAGAEAIQAGRRALNRHDVLSRGAEGSDESIVHAVRGWWNAGTSRDKSEEDLKADEERTKSRQEEQKAQMDRTIKSAELEDKLTDARRRTAGLRGGAWGEHRFDEAELRRAQRDEVRANARVEEARSGVEVRDEDGRVHKRGAGGVADFAAVTVALERQRSAQANLLDYDTKRTEQMERQKEAASELVNRSREQLSSARAQVAVEQKKFESKGAHFARLAAPMRAQVVALAAKKKAGVPLNDRELGTLEEAGVGAEYTDKERFSRLSQNERGALKEFGEDKDLKSAEGNFWKTLGSLAKAEGEQVAVSAKLKAAKEQEIAASIALSAVIARIASDNAKRNNLPGIPIDGMPAPKVGVGVPGLDPSATPEPAPYVDAFAVPGQMARIPKGAGDVAQAVDGARQDMHENTNDLIKSINSLAHEFAKNHKKIADSVRAQAIKQWYNQL
jgi:hypothetical protein